ncbi:MAG: mep [Rubritepida sp.]|nr:mep [Rubritepida sp.]
MTSFRLAFAAVALMSVPLLAQAEPKPGTPAAASSTCSAEQLGQIDAAFTDAGAALETAIRQISAEPQHPELHRWFGSTPAKFVRMNLERVALQVGRGRPATIECLHPTTCDASIFAYARQATGVMGFCRAFFGAGREGRDSRFGILVHEVSHVAIGTRDATYQPRNVLALAKDEPATSAMNADSYEYLVEALAAR